MTPSYKIDLKGNSKFDDFRYHLGAFNDPIHVDKTRYPDVAALLKSTVTITVSFRKKGNTDGESDMSFSFLLPRDAPPHDGKDFSYFTYIDGAYMANVDELINDPNNRHSNGEIISTHDLLGSTPEIEFCPVVPFSKLEDSKRLTDLIRLIEVRIDLLGRQALLFVHRVKMGLRSSHRRKTIAAPDSITHFLIPRKLSSKCWINR